MEKERKTRKIKFHGKFIDAISESEDPYDIHQKGLKYDKLKKRNDELVKALKSALPYLPTGNKPFQMGFIGQEVERLIKNN